MQPALAAKRRKGRASPTGERAAALVAQVVPPKRVEAPQRRAAGSAKTGSASQLRRPHRCTGTLGAEERRLATALDRVSTFFLSPSSVRLHLRRSADSGSPPHDF